MLAYRPNGVKNMRLLLVEDEAKVASFIARALREHAYAVDTAECGERALQLAGEYEYDVILLDLRLPDIDGILVCRKLRDAGVDSAILMLTARGLVEQRVAGLDAGADDYLQKPFVLSELQARVRALVRRSFKNGRSLRCGDLFLDRQRRTATRGNSGISLTSREFSLLEFLLLHAGQTVGRTEIVEHVWDQHFDSETNLVEVYVNRLRQKIDHDRDQKLIHTIRGIGYRMGAAE
jgi:two-component system, OmpR family, copper resistance phosphate regulon response regulator CusR